MSHHGDVQPCTWRQDGARPTASEDHVQYNGIPTQRALISDEVNASCRASLAHAALVALFAEVKRGARR